MSKNLNDVRLPLLILHGSADTITSCQMSQLLFEKAGSSDKTLKIYRDAWHMLWFDKCQDDVYRDVQEWMDQRKGHIFRLSNSHLLDFAQKTQLSNSNLREIPSEMLKKATGFEG